MEPVRGRDRRGLATDWAWGSIVKNKNIKRHTTQTIVIWPSHKLWQLDPQGITTCDFQDIDMAIWIHLIDKKNPNKKQTNKQQKTPTNNTKDIVQQCKMLSLEYFIFQVNKTTVTRMNHVYRNTRATLNAEIPWATSIRLYTQVWDRKSGYRETVYIFKSVHEMETMK